MAGELALRDGSRIAIIGGGPAGSFFAHFAQKWAEKKGLAVIITIFDGKNFLQRGPQGCNLCAGVIASSLEAKLQEEGLFLPEKRIISRIGGYCLHFENDTLHLSCTENGQPGIATVFRGNGPRYSSFPDIISFDDYLLSYARDRGAEVIPHPVWDILPSSSPSAPVVLFYGERHSLQRYEADLVVGAFGVNSFLSRQVWKLNWGYVPPATITAFQAEFRLGQEKLKEHLQNEIHVFAQRSKLIRYATVIPKGDYATVTLVGRKNATPGLMKEFLAFDQTRKILSALKSHCFCYPKIAISASRHPFAHRFVLIGDASYCRHYKNGIESAFLTAKMAAEAAFCSGVAENDFASNYMKPSKRIIARDNVYGRVLFRLNDMISSVPLLARAHLGLAEKNPATRASRKIRNILWNMFTGAIPYRSIFFAALDLRLQFSLVQNTIGLLLRRMKKVLT